MWLCDTSPALRARITARFANRPQVAAIAPETIEIGVPDESLDVAAAVSVLQYLTRDELRAALGLWLAKLKPGGKLVVGDVIPPDVGMATDTKALLSFAFQGGFLTAALAGLVRTALSDYRKLRDTLGLTTYREEEMRGLLREAGFADIRRIDNIGHNPARMSFTALKPA